jgi:hypothetical protein
MNVQDQRMKKKKMMMLSQAVKNQDQTKKVVKKTEVKKMKVKKKVQIVSLRVVGHKVAAVQTRKKRRRKVKIMQ